MGIRRVKDQKQQSQLKVSQTLYSYRAPASVASSSLTQSSVDSTKSVKSMMTSRSLFAYDVKLIFNDLKKTALITVLILLGLALITWYLKR